MGGYDYFMSGPPVPQLELTESDIEVPDAVAGREITVAYAYHNASSRPIRILGGNNC